MLKSCFTDVVLASFFVSYQISFVLREVRENEKVKRIIYWR
jgi:hypothetical protein